MTYRVVVEPERDIQLAAHWILGQIGIACDGGARRASFAERSPR